MSDNQQDSLLLEYISNAKDWRTFESLLHTLFATNDSNARLYPHINHRRLTLSVQMVISLVSTDKAFAADLADLLPNITPINSRRRILME